jgi:hypothetical protein
MAWPDQLRRSAVLARTHLSSSRGTNRATTNVDLLELDVVALKHSSRSCAGKPARAWEGSRGLGDRDSLLPCVMFAGNSMKGGGVRYCGPRLTEILRRAIPPRYRKAILTLSCSSFGIDRPMISWEKSRVMKNEKLKSTTVRFRDSEVDLIERLQEKLGLGMVHVIRLAVRRLAENENLLSIPSIAKKR